MDLDKKPCELSKKILLKNYRVLSAKKISSSHAKEMNKIKNENKVFFKNKNVIFINFQGSRKTIIRDYFTL